MKTNVLYSKVLERQVSKRKIPLQILVKLQGWVDLVERRGLEEARKVPGYHDEPCQGQMRAYRSIRLNRGWRAYYFINGERDLRVVTVERVDKHEYGK